MSKRGERYAKSIKEDIKTLMQLELKLKNAFPRKVIQLIKILKTGKSNLKEASQFVGVSYRTARRYWKFYQEKGVEGIKNWKDTRKKAEKLSDKELIEVMKKHYPTTLREAVEIIEKETGVRYSIKGLYSKFKKLKIKLKTGRPSHIKKKSSLIAPFKKMIASLPLSQRSKLYFADEIRIGLRSSHKKCWTLPTIRPVWKSKISYQFRYLLTFINPLRGDIHAFEMNSMKSDLIIEVVKNFLKEVNGDAVIIWDNAGSHVKTAKELVKEGIDKIKFLPPYSPELNPVERFFLEIRKVLANKVFNDLDEEIMLIKNEIENWKRFPQKLIKLTAFPYIRGHY